MRLASPRHAVLLVTLAGCGARRPAAAAAPVFDPQPADTAFDATVARPAYPRGAGPRVVIDEAHGEFHTMRGRYRPLATLLANDGFRVAPGTARFTAARLRGADVLVVANALAPRTAADAAPPAFTAAECDAVRAWVAEGGALLLVADHEPMGAAARALAARLGVDMSGGRTADPAHADPAAGSPTWLVFERDAGPADARVADHAITRGRDATERVRRVVTFTGQSLRGPPGSVAILALADGAEDLLAGGRRASAAGRAQMVALALGRGRVVVAGEAAMLTAQVAWAPALGERRFGFGWPGTDDRQLALNTVRWLARALD